MALSFVIEAFCALAATSAARRASASAILVSISECVTFLDGTSFVVRRDDGLDVVGGACTLLLLMFCLPEQRGDV